MTNTPSSTSSGAPGPALVRAPPVAPSTSYAFHGQSIQAKMDVTPSSDAFETEADRVADHTVQQDALNRPPPMISSINGGTLPTSIQNKAQRELDKPREDDKETSLTSSKRKESTGAPVQLKTKSTGGAATNTGQKEEEKASPKPPSVQRLLAQRAPSTAAGADAALKDEDKKKLGTASSASKSDLAQKKPIQRDAVGADGGAVPTATESTIASMQASGGSPLASDTRSFMESRIGHDFSGVRVHDSPAAHQASNDLNARAFTIGRDVFFGAGQYNPGTKGGQHLLAHELTHTVQQNGGSGSVQSKRIQRADDSSSDTKIENGNNLGNEETGASKVFHASDEGTIRIEGKNKEMTLPELQLPAFNGKPKGADGAPGEDAKKIESYGQRNWSMNKPTTGTNQRELWITKAKSELSGKLKDSLTKMYSKGKDSDQNGGNDGDKSEILYLRHKSSSVKNAGHVFIGTADELSKHPDLLLPSWNRQGTKRTGRSGYHVDHIHEKQLGGKHDWENLWLLRARANTSSGGLIRGALEGPIDALRKKAEEDGFWSSERGGNDPGTEYIKKNWILTFQCIKEKEVSWTEVDRESYSQKDIEEGEQLAGLHLMDNTELLEAGLKIPENEQKRAQPEIISIYPYKEGGTNFQIERKGKDTWKLRNRPEDAFLGGFTHINISYSYQNDKADGESIGSVKGTPKPTKHGTQYPPANLPLIKDSRRLGYNVYFDPDELRRFPRSSRFIGLSPMNFSDFGINNNGLFQGHGNISATHGFFPGLDIPFEVIGDRSFIDYPLPTENLSLGPVSIDQAALQLGFDSTGVFLGGTADISVAQVGSGHLDAIANQQGARLEGDFNFDTEFLDPASARFVYDFNTDQLSLTLNAGVQEGKIPGINRGEVTATIDNEGVDFSGTLYPSGFLDGAEVALAYTREDGVTIELNEYRPPIGDLPAIRDAVVSLGVNKPPDSDEWLFYGTGSAQFALPYTAGGLNIAVNNDLVTIIGTAAVERPPAAGSLNVTITNQEVDEDGNPVEGETLDTFRVFGRGSASLTFGIITATAGLELTEDGEIVVDGELALPPTYEVFPREPYDRQLLHVEPPEFPLWGVSVAGVGIGIFGFFDAYLNFDAYVGPGTLNDVTLRATYTFSRPEDTVIEGEANLNIPAGAGFTVDIGGGVRGRLATAEVSGRIGLAARLGLEANAGSDVNIHWTPSAGLSLSAEAYANVSPKFRVSANARIRASVDLWLAEPSYTWGPWEQVLGEFGPDMMVEARFPVEWSEQDGLDLDLDDIEIQRPEVDYAALMKDAFLELV